MQVKIDRQEKRTHHSWCETVDAQEKSIILVLDNIECIRRGNVKFNNQLLRLRYQEETQTSYYFSVLNITKYHLSWLA